MGGFEPFAVALDQVDYSSNDDNLSSSKACSVVSTFQEVRHLVVEFLAVFVSTTFLISNTAPTLAFFASSLVMCTLGSLSMTVPPAEPMANTSQPVLNADKAVLISPVVPLALALLGRLNPIRALLKIGAQTLSSFLAVWIYVVVLGEKLPHIEDLYAVDSTDFLPIFCLQAILNASVIFFVMLSMNEIEMWLVMLQETRNFKPVYDLTFTVSLCLGLALMVNVVGLGVTPCVQMAVDLSDSAAYPFATWQAWAAPLAGTIIGVIISAMALLDLKDTRRGFLRGLSSVAPVAVEFFGTAIVVLVRFASDGYVSIAAALLALQICCFRKSGAHFNPVLTLAHVTFKRNNWKVGGYYIVLQTMGAIVGAGIARLVRETGSLQDAFVATPEPTTAGIICASVAEVLGSGVLACIFVNNMMMDSAARGPFYALTITIASVIGYMQATSNSVFWFANPAMAMGSLLFNMEVTPDALVRVLAPLVVAAIVPRFYQLESAY